MDMVFVYEDKIAQDAAGNYYTGSAFSQKVFDRYLQHFDHITLLMRKANIDPNDMEKLSRMNRIDTSRIDVVILPNLRSSLRSFIDPKAHREFRKKIIEQIIPGRAVILRAPSDSGTIAADYCHANGIPYLAEAVGCPWDSMWNHSLKGKVLAPGMWKDFRRTMRNADYAVYVTSEFLQRRYPTNGKSAAISDVELQPVNDIVLEYRVKKICNHSGKFKVGTAGALHVAYKGQRYVIEALSKMKAQGNADFEYHLAGGGDAATLKTLAEQLGVSDQVVFDGSLPHDAMFAWLDDLDVYIQPSTVESMPRALIEAMSRGLPCVGSRVGGIPELLSGDSIFKSKNVNQICRIMMNLSSDWLVDHAIADFQKAKFFAKDGLDKKRFNLLQEYIRSMET